MADVRVQQAIKIVDPTTNANEAAVDGSGNLQVILAANTGVDIGDVDVTSIVPLTGATNLGKAVDSVAGGTDTGVALLAVRDDVLAGLTPAEGDYAVMSVDASGALWVNISAGSVSITGTVDTELPAAAALTDDFANPTAPAVGAFGMVWDGATWDRSPGTSTDGTLVNLGTNNDVAIEGNAITGTDGAAGPAETLSVAGTEVGGNLQELRVDSDGHLQVDILTGAGSDIPTGPTASETISSALAAGASADLDSAELTEKEFLAKVTCTSSVPFKAVLKSLENTVTSTIVTFFGKAGEAVQFAPPHRSFISASNTAGTDVFRVTMTNLDTSEAADVYASFFYQNN